MPSTLHADELFSEGKLHLQHLPLCSSAAKSVGSCKISPRESIKSSRDDEPRRILTERSSRYCGVEREVSRKSMSTKIEQSAFCLTLKACMRKYFMHTTSSDKSSSAVATARNAHQISAVSKSPAQTKQIQRDLTHTYNDNNVQSGKPSQRRRSFSNAMKQALVPKCSTHPNRSSFSCQFNDYEFQKRRDTELLEIENSIQGAIAHCKQSLSECKSSQPIRDRQELRK